jgi:hypothetical protein
MQNVLILLRNGVIIHAGVLLPMTLFLTAPGPDKAQLGARMDMLQMSFFLTLPMLQEYKIITDQNQ